MKINFMYNKYTATQLFDGYRLRQQDDVLIMRENVVEAIIPYAEAGDGVQVLDGIITPGFINCHCHLELSHMKGLIEEKTGLINFVGAVVQKRKLDEDVIMSAVSDAETAMINNGIVAVGDISNTTKTLQQKLKGRLYYHNFIEVLGFDAAIAEKNFSFFKKIYEDFAEHFSKRQVSLTPHAPYSLSKKLWDATLQFNEGKVLSIHNQETEDENLWFVQKSGGFADMYQRMQLDTAAFSPSRKSSIQTYLGDFDQNQPAILVHNVFTSEEDIAFAEAVHKNLFWCFCPNANAYITNRLPNIPSFIKKDVSCVLGTDSLASNHQLSIWEEIKTIQQFYAEIPLQTLLQWATLNGAKALQVDNRFGSFEKDKSPGVVLIDTLSNKVKKII